MTALPNQVALAEVVADRALWPRQALDRGRVEEFVALYAAEGTSALPPLEVVPDGEGRMLLADGWHRRAALERLGIVVLPTVEVAAPDGVDRRGFVYSHAVGRSSSSSKPLSRAEKQAAVHRLLELYPEASDREIGRLAGVDHKTVGRARTRGDSPPESSPPVRVVLPEVAAERLLAAFEKVREARGVGFMDWVRGGDRTGGRMADLLWNRYGEDAAIRAAEFVGWLEEAWTLLESEEGEA